MVNRPSAEASRPAESCTTALNRTTVPGATPSRFRVTRYTPMSAVPRVCHGPLPTCAAKVTRSKPPPGTVAPSATVPYEPSAGAFTVIDGPSAGLASLCFAFSTSEDIAGTVTVALPSAPLLTFPWNPYRPSKSMPAEKVSSVTVFASAALFTATRYSTCSLASIRENAYTPGPSAAYRSTCAPSASAGLSLRSFASPAMPRYSSPSLPYRSCEPGVPPITASLLYDGVFEANMSCRASLSPPAPVKPCSSP